MASLVVTGFLVQTVSTAALVLPVVSFALAGLVRLIVERARGRRVQATPASRADRWDPPTLSLRPGVLYGPGRDAGLTSSPTTAMKHVALGQPYEIPFCSRQDYLFAPDVGAAVGTAVLEPFDGYGVFTLPSWTLTTREIVASMRRVAAGLGLADPCQITVGDAEVPFICDLDYAPFVEAFPNVPQTPLDDAVRKSLEVFVEHARRGWIGN